MDIAVIADDLTGANANGALLTAKGFLSATCLGLAQWDPAGFAGYAAVAVSTDSRLLGKQDAWNAVYAAVKMFAAESPSLIAKRVDSTLRGNVGAEIEAALKAMDDTAPAGAQPAVAIVVPSYPSSGRIAAGGYLIVHGVPLQRSPIAQDSATPIHETCVTSIIAQQTSLKTGFVPLKTVLAGASSCKAAITSLQADGCRIIVCDAVTDEDITTIAESLRNAPFRIVSVDPGPFTATLAAVRVSTPRAAFDDRVLLVVGSTTELTRRQLEALRLAHPTHICKVDCNALLQENLREAEIRRVVEDLLASPPEAEVLGVCTVERIEDIFPMEDVARSMGITSNQVSVRITQALSAITRRLLEHSDLRIGGLYTSGGEVTVSTIRELDAKGFSVRDEVLPLAVYGRLIQGLYPDFPMVTKGGFVGGTESLVQCIEYLFTKISTRKHQLQD